MAKKKKEELFEFMVKFYCIHCEKAEVKHEDHAKGVRKCKVECAYSGRDRKIPPQTERDWRAFYVQ